MIAGTRRQDHVRVLDGPGVRLGPDVVRSGYLVVPVFLSTQLPNPFLPLGDVRRRDARVHGLVVILVVVLLLLPLGLAWGDLGHSRQTARLLRAVVESRQRSGRR